MPHIRQRFRSVAGISVSQSSASQKQFPHIVTRPIVKTSKSASHSKSFSWEDRTSTLLPHLTQDRLEAETLISALFRSEANRPRGINEIRFAAGGGKQICQFHRAWGTYKSAV